MKDNKVPIIIIVILILLIIAVGINKARNRDDVEETDLPEESALEDTGLIEESGLVASAHDTDLAGVWQNEVDRKYVLELDPSGIAREFYAAELTTIGSWQISDGFLSLTLGGRTYDYDLTHLDSKSFSGIYTGSGVEVSFIKI